MTNRSETPRTDAFIESRQSSIGWTRGDTNALGDFARQLERELTAAQALAEQYRKALEEFGMHKDNCAKNLDPFFEISCDCGLDAALSAKSEGGGR